MLHSRLALLAGLLALALGSATPSSQSRVTVAPAVASRTAAGETVRVVIGVDARFVPEGLLAGGAAVAAQRQDVRASVASVMTRATAAGVVAEPAFDSIPFFPARVTRDSLARLQTMRGVVSVEEVLVAEPTLAYSVPLTNAPAAHNAGFAGSGWAVAVLDSGVDYTHSMLYGAMVSEACFSSDGTSLCPGGAPQSTAPGSGRECNASVEGCDHGTHVASTAVGALGTGASTGVAPGAWLIPMQVFNYQPQLVGIRTSTVDYTRALTRVLALAGPNNVNRIAAVNMSLGGGQFASQAQCDAASPSTKAAVDNLRSIGIATVVASGNNSFTNSMGFPGCLSTVVSVGNTTKFSPMQVTASSNEASFLSLLAPGTNIYAASFFGFYTEKTGTSMAAPHVAGAWAILKQAVPSASVTSVLAALRATGTPVVDTRTGRTFPFINVNAARVALASGAFSTPGAPTGFSASASGNTVSLSWAPPAAGSGGTPTGYTVVVRGAPGGPAQTAPVGNVTAISAAVPNGVYHLSVVATNAVGSGGESAGVTITVPTAATPPGAPTGLSASSSGSTASFSWNAPAGGGAVSGYVLLAGTTPGFATPVATVPVGAARSFTTGGVPAGVYYARVVAQGPGGTSGASNEATLVVGGATLPGAPTLHAPAVGGTTVTLSWTPGAGAPTSYVLTASVTPGGGAVATLPVAGTSVTIPGVPRGIYYARVTAHNAAGGGPPSNQVTIAVP